MDPEHTLFVFDCRPIKAAVHHALFEYEAGRLDQEQAIGTVRALVASIPLASLEDFSRTLDKLIVYGSFESAHKIVDLLDDQTLRSWVFTMLKTLGSLVLYTIIFSVFLCVVKLATS